MTRNVLDTTPVGAFPSDAASSHDWQRDDLLRLFGRADWLTRQPRHRLAKLAPNATVGLLFYQNSTRTRISFQAATCLLGGRYIGFDSAATTRAGDFFQETLEDTVRVVGGYADLLVLRHVDDDAAQRAAAVAGVPVVNAYSGESDHPTQGMLDTWMMRRSLGDLVGARIGFVGDPGCRALRADVATVAKFGPAEIVFLTPEDAPPSPEQCASLTAQGIRHSTVDSMAELVRRTDVIAMIPFELPDFHVATAQERRSGNLATRYRLTRRLLEGAGRHVTVLHTGPRGEELPAEVDGLPNVRYFEGVRGGMFLRAALMHVLWEGRGIPVSDVDELEG